MGIHAFLSMRLLCCCSADFQPMLLKLVTIYFSFDLLSCCEVRMCEILWMQLSVTLWLIGWSGLHPNVKKIYIFKNKQVCACQPVHSGPYVFLG